MRAVIQRVNEASVAVNGDIVARIGKGLLVLLGITHDDTQTDAEWMARKVSGLRIFEDDEGKLNLGLEQIGGSVLAVSQFTLYGNANKGRRPSFVNAARPHQAQPLYDNFCEKLAEHGVPVAKGVFQAEMRVSLVNDGPVTLILESKD